MNGKLPTGLVLSCLNQDSPAELLAGVREFCLRMVKEVYGYDYREDWHGDLDSLLNPESSAYFVERRGAFFVLQNNQGEIVGTAGLRALSTRPDIIARAAGRYPEPDKVASHWRMYVDSRYRKLGLGQQLIDLRCEVAAKLGYERVYFHCSKDAKPLRRYWETNGFTCFMEDEMSAHYDGPVHSTSQKNTSDNQVKFDDKVKNFWDSLTKLTAHLGSWETAHDHVPNHLCHHCQSLCQLLKAQQAQVVCADPRNASKVRAVREAYADTWSSIYSRLEFQVAEEIWPQVENYADFQRLTNTHPLFLNADDVAEAELDLLRKHGVDLTKAKICMIGPGAIPNTALAFARAGAHVTAVDCYQPACTWVNRWFGKIFADKPYQVIEGYAEQQDFSQYDVVIVAAMLYNRGQVISALEASSPQFVLLRSTANRRPMSMLMPQTTELDLRYFNKAAYVAETNPPLQVGNFSLLYQYI